MNNLRIFLALESTILLIYRNTRMKMSLIAVNFLKKNRWLFKYFQTKSANSRHLLWFKFFKKFFLQIYYIVVWNNLHCRERLGINKLLSSVTHAWTTAIFAFFEQGSYLKNFLFKKLASTACCSKTHSSYSLNITL